MSRAKALTPEAIRSMARSHTVAMLNVLVGVARQRGAPPAARVMAANSVLDRGWGRANVTHTDADGGPIQVIIRQVIDITGEKQNETVLIEHDATG